MVPLTRPPDTPPRAARPSTRRVASTVVVAHGAGAVVGAATWVVAARLLAEAAVGTGVALTGVLTWCGLLASGGLGFALIALGPDLDPAEQLTASRVAVTRASLLGSGAGALSVLGLHLVDGPLGSAGGQPLVALALVVGAGATSAAIVADAAAVAGGVPRLVVVRSLVFSLVRLALLLAGAAAGWDPRDVLVGGWALAAVLALVPTLVRLTGATPATGAGRRRRFRFGPDAWANHLASIAAQSPALLLPVVVAAVAGPRSAGAFGAAWQVAGIAALASPSMATAVFAHGDRRPAALLAAARRAGRDLLVVLVPAVVAVIVVGPVALSLLGPHYRSSGAVALVLVALALLPDAVSNLAVATWRARRRYALAVGLNGLISVVALSGAAVLGRTHGATGAGAAWLAAQGLGAAVVAVGLARTRSAPP